MLVRRITYLLLWFLWSYAQSGQAAVIAKDKRWNNPSELQVVFLNGSPKLRALVKRIAPEWVEESGLTFRFFDDPKNAPQNTHIRISFLAHSGSRLGNHGDYTGRFSTMNLAGLVQVNRSEEMQKRLILHEFGHALGLEHEYRNRHWPYGQNAQKAIIEDCQPQMIGIGYSPVEAAKHCVEINSTLDKQHAISTAYDERSIMNYPLEFRLKKGSIKTIKAATELSLLDRYAIQRFYPKQSGAQKLNSSNETK